MIKNIIFGLLIVGACLSPVYAQEIEEIVFTGTPILKNIEGGPLLTCTAHITTRLPRALRALAMTTVSVIPACRESFDRLRMHGEKQEAGIIGTKDGGGSPLPDTDETRNGA